MADAHTKIFLRKRVLKFEYITLILLFLQEPAKTKFTLTQLKKGPVQKALPLMEFLSQIPHVNINFLIKLLQWKYI